MEVPPCLTETHLLSAVAVNGILTAYEIITNDDQFDNFKSLAAF